MKSEIKQSVLVIAPEENLLNGQYDTTITDMLKKNMEEGVGKVVFNMQQVKYINSTGLGLLLTVTQKIKSAGGQMALCCVSEPVTKLLKMTKLEKVFMVFTEETNAVSFLKG